MTLSLSVILLEVEGAVIEARGSCVLLMAAPHSEETPGADELAVLAAGVGQHTAVGQAHQPLPAPARRQLGRLNDGVLFAKT